MTLAVVALSGGGRMTTDSSARFQCERVQGDRRRIRRHMKRLGCVWALCRKECFSTCMGLKKEDNGRGHTPILLRKMARMSDWSFSGRRLGFESVGFSSRGSSFSPLVILSTFGRGRFTFYSS